MSLRRLLVLVNVFGIVGAVLSALIIPRSTTVKVWAGISIVVIAILNIYVLTTYKSKLAVGDAPAEHWKKQLLISVLVGVILLALVHWL
jgi:membrane associated rhomboid family serine protease